MKFSKSKAEVFFSMLVVLLPSCGSSSKDDAPSQNATAGYAEITDSSLEGLKSFVQNGSFKIWKTKQPAVIDSATAHGTKTRTYFNDIAAEGAKSMKNPLPKNSILVKELFAADGTTLNGQAVMIKIEDTSGGSSWLWFEGFAPNYSSTYYGVGLTTCTGCHSSGTDFVRTTVPN